MFRSISRFTVPFHEIIQDLFASYNIFFCFATEIVVSRRNLCFKVFHNKDLSETSKSLTPISVVSCLSN